MRFNFGRGERAVARNDNDTNISTLERLRRQMGALRLFVLKLQVYRGEIERRDRPSLSFGDRRLSRRPVVELARNR